MLGELLYPEDLDALRLTLCASSKSNTVASIVMTRSGTWEDIAKVVFEVPSIRIEVRWNGRLSSQAYQQRRDISIPEKWRLPADVLSNLPTDVTGIPREFLSDREIELTECTASQLAKRIAKRETTSVEVTVAFCHRAAIAQQLVNCLTEIFFEDAVHQATELDRVLEETGKPIGPLHGVPFSIKDHYNIKGLRTTAGYISYSKFPPKEKDALVVEILRKAGAVFYVKTNNPQCMMVLETVSNIYGRTLNPKNTKLGAGGSSGGEGALLALRGSPVGLGSDIGGYFHSA
ncbi:hypothetical protein ATERTT37_004467 [Aspergillus terreus]